MAQEAFESPVAMEANQDRHGLPEGRAHFGQGAPATSGKSSSGNNGSSTLQKSSHRERLW
jgi:hypothetical protein